MIIVAGVDESCVWVLPWLEDDAGEVLELVAGILENWFPHDRYGLLSRTNVQINCREQGESEFEENSGAAGNVKRWSRFGLGPVGLFSLQGEAVTNVSCYGFLILGTVPVEKKRNLSVGLIGSLNLSI